MNTRRTGWKRWSIGSYFSVYKDGELYLERRRLIQTPVFGVYLHHIAMEDKDRDLHDHPWTFGTLILKGGYTESYRPEADKFGTEQHRVWKRWSYHKMPLRAAHKIETLKDNTYTLVFTGPRRKDWGFHTPEGYVRWQDYLVSYGSIDKVPTTTVG